MGNAFDCNCFAESIEGLASLQEDTRLNQIINKLQVGGTFYRPVLLGLTAQEVFVRLSDDTSHLSWKTTKAWTGEEKGQVDLTNDSISIKSNGTVGIQFVNISTTVIEINAENQSIRDDWIVMLNELRMKWKQDTKRPISTVSAEGHSNKTEYFTKRQEEIEARKKDNEEKKKKYNANGMKYTAQIMAGQN
jgi:hypothetical protein